MAPAAAARRYAGARPRAPSKQCGRTFSMAAAGFAKLCGSFRHGHRRTTSEGNPITLSGGRASTSSQDWVIPEEVSTVPVKRVMVVVDQSNEARLALLWALSHVVHKLDVVTLLYVLHSRSSSEFSGSEESLKIETNCCQLTNSLKNLCLEHRPEIEVELVVVEGDKGPTIVGQAKKLDASVLVLGQRKLGFLWRLLRLRGDDLVDYCIQNAECLTLAVRRKSKKVGGYLINSKWQKNFWLLA